jgi:hypothetical protein
MQEYQSIMKNDVWEIVLRQGKSMVTSKRIYKIKHAADGSIEKYKSDVCGKRILLERGSQPSDFDREEQPPRTVHKRSDFRGSQQVQREHMAPEIVQTQMESSFQGSMQTQSEPDLIESQLAQRESRSFNWSSPSGPGGRETSSKTDR